MADISTTCYMTMGLIPDDSSNADANSTSDYMTMGLMPNDIEIVAYGRGMFRGIGEGITEGVG